MTTNRNKLCAGLVSKNSFLSLAHIRKVIFEYDSYENAGHDLINNVTYPVHNHENHKCYYMSNLIYLNSVLDKLGYPEVLSDDHINKIMNEDFKKVFIESGIMKSLYSSAMEDFSSIFCHEPFDILKGEFNINPDEIKFNEKKNGIQKIKRR